MSMGIVENKFVPHTVETVIIVFRLVCMSAMATYITWICKSHFLTGIKISRAVYVVSVTAFYSDDSSLNPIESYNV